MSPIRQFLRAYRLLPGQIVRLDADLFDRLDALAREWGKSVEEVVGETLATSIRELDDRMANNRRWESLTPREQQVAAWTCLGYTNDEIAGGLVISINTVRSHMRSILEKYEVSSKAELRLALSGWDFTGWVEAAESPAEATTLTD